MCLCIVNQEEDKCWYRPCRFLSYPYLHFRGLWKCLENARVRVSSPELTWVTTCKTPCKERKIPKKRSDDSLSLVNLSRIQLSTCRWQLKEKEAEKKKNIYIYIYIYISMIILTTTIKRLHHHRSETLNDLSFPLIHNGFQWGCVEEI